MADNEGAGVEASGKVGLHEHLDNPLVFVFLIGLVVYAMGAVGRYVGNTYNVPGVTTFFGG
jgi:hypothetical protein